MPFDTSGHSFERDIIMLNVRWYLSYKLSYRDLKEMAHERGLCVDHTTIYRWVIKFTPGMEMAIRNRKKPVGRSWRMDETYIKINGQWEYLYRAVDKEGQTVDYLLTAKRDKKAAKRFFKKAIGSNCIPEKINIDKSGANTATIKDYNKSEKTNIEIRQNKYLNNLIEQDHRSIKQLSRATLWFKRFWTASITLAGFECMHMLRKNQVLAGGQTPAEQFYVLMG